MTDVMRKAGSAETSRADGPRDALAGVGTLLRFMLRRDRVRLPAWVLGLAMIMAYFAVAIEEMMSDSEALDSMAMMGLNPAMALFTGPGFGLDAPTVPRLLAGMYGLYILLAVAIMSILTISRHTRVEEQSGRAELIRANMTGQHSQLTAALLLTVVMNILVSALMIAVFLGVGINPPPDTGGAVLYGLGVGAVGIAFAGVAAVTAQLSANSRVASGIAGAVLAASFVIRGLGDMSAVQNGGLAWLSWLSPLGWAQQTAPFTLDRWWPLLPLLVFAAATATCGYALQSRRDLASGIMPDRLGRENAPGWLRGALSLAYRLQRGMIIGWSVAVLLMGIVFGAFTRTMVESADGLPDNLVDSLMGGTEGIASGYLGFMGFYYAVIIVVFVMLSVHALRAEEYELKTEPLLATPMSRSSWLLSWSGVVATGALLLFLLAGLSSGLSAALSMSDWAIFWPTVVGYLAHTSAVWVFLGLAIALYGLAPRFLGFAWAVYLYSAMLSMFGPMTGMDEDLIGTSVFEHVGNHPAADITWGAVLALTVIAIVLTIIGVVGFRRRDLVTA